MIELTIGIDDEGHVCKRSGFLRFGTEAQMATAAHIAYLLDEMGREQDETEVRLVVSRPEAVQGWQLEQMLDQMKRTA